jgi:hypothetical protein
MVHWQVLQGDGSQQACWIQLLNVIAGYAIDSSRVNASTVTEGWYKLLCPLRAIQWNRQHPTDLYEAISIFVDTIEVSGLWTAPLFSLHMLPNEPFLCLRVRPLLC